MKIVVVPARELSNDHRSRWMELQRANPELRSPFFHPAYTREAAAVLAGVEVAIAEEGGSPIAYFPFQRAAGGRGLPVGGSLNDFQGLVAAPGTSLDAAELIRGCRLSSWRFTQLLASQRSFQRWHWLVADSPSMDVSEGFNAYAKARREQGSTLISRIADKARHAARDIGPLRFESETADPRVFDALVAWKSRQYERIRTVNPLARPDVLAFLRRLLVLEEGDFRGVLSAVYFGERLAAVHLGLRFGDVLHLWFPTYNEELGKYSPGSVFFVEQAKAAERMGVRRIDFGCGNERFKTSLRSCGTQVAEGAVGLGLLSAAVQRRWLYTKNWLQTSRFREPARSVFRRVRGLFLHGQRSDTDG